VEEIVIDADLTEDEPSVELESAGSDVIELSADDEFAVESEDVSLEADDAVVEISEGSEASGAAPPFDAMEPDTLEMPELPGHAPAARGAVAPADDDEPEIEITYGTREAIALQKELDLGEEFGGAKSAPPPTFGSPVEAPRSSPSAARAQPPTPAPAPLAARGAAASPLPARPATPVPTQATPQPARFAAAKPRPGVEVAEVVSPEPPPRPRTLGDVLRAALTVGKGR
jgi:hypothetical protein